MLEIRNLGKTFYPNTINQHVVFRNFSLKIEPGQFVTVIGSNGAGKSSLLNILAGSLEMDQGTIQLNGKDISSLSEPNRAKNIGRVFQTPGKGIAPSLTVMENLALARNKGKAFGLLRLTGPTDGVEFQQLLGELGMGLEDKLNTKAGLLSGGQQQALSLVLSMMVKPDLLLLDEHTTALDPKAANIISSLTQKLVDDYGITTLMVTHDLTQALELGNRLIMLSGGEIVLDVSGDEKAKLSVHCLLERFSMQLVS